MDTEIMTLTTMVEEMATEPATESVTDKSDIKLKEADHEQAEKTATEDLAIQEDVEKREKLSENDPGAELIMTTGSTTE